MEKIAETIERKQSLCGNLVEAESDDREKDCKNYEGTQLNGFASDGVNGCNGDPVPRNETGGR